MSVNSLATFNCSFINYDNELCYRLPDELTTHVFSFLDVQSLSRAARCCLKLRHLIQNENLWRLLCIRDFGSFQEKRKNWKIFYQEKAQMAYLNIPFPGEAGIFSVNPIKSWQAKFSPGLLLREMNFINENQACIFREFSILGYQDGRLACSIKMAEKECIELKIYFDKIDASKKLSESLFDPITEGLTNSIYLTDIELIKKIFRVTCAWHQLPLNEREFLKEVIWAKNWKLITPLTEKEVLDIKIARDAYEQSLQLGILHDIIYWLMVKLIGPIVPLK